MATTPARITAQFTAYYEPSSDDAYKEYAPVILDPAETQKLAVCLKDLNEKSQKRFKILESALNTHNKIVSNLEKLQSKCENVQNKIQTLSTEAKQLSSQIEDKNKQLTTAEKFINPIVKLVPWVFESAAAYFAAPSVLVIGGVVYILVRAISTTVKNQEQAQGNDNNDQNLDITPNLSRMPPMNVDEAQELRNYFNSNNSKLQTINRLFIVIEENNESATKINELYKSYKTKQKTLEDDINHRKSQLTEKGPFSFLTKAFSATVDAFVHPVDTITNVGKDQIGAVKSVADTVKEKFPSTSGKRKQPEDETENLKQEETTSAQPKNKKQKKTTDHKS